MQLLNKLSLQNDEEIIKKMKKKKALNPIINIINYIQGACLFKKQKAKDNQNTYELSEYETKELIQKGLNTLKKIIDTKEIKRIKKELKDCLKYFRPSREEDIKMIIHKIRVYAMIPDIGV